MRKRARSAYHPSHMSVSFNIGSIGTDGINLLLDGGGTVVVDYIHLPNGEPYVVFHGSGDELRRFASIISSVLG